MYLDRDRCPNHPYSLHQPPVIDFYGLRQCVTQVGFVPSRSAIDNSNERPQIETTTNGPTCAILTAPPARRLLAAMSGLFGRENTSSSNSSHLAGSFGKPSMRNPYSIP
ncbi:hypothetical protein D9613_012148 [Agrocybe pediades]|uniref:Uncharacterized protein n=1 Tax=Agrocybe pediades TaxID=84607 RepID=A0A8H4R2Q6_9AGAR|nr:hypothetical protein D9613_012175 [Agrocybe pediades]KAF4621773.1 hypothetical protein D9613_012148 [Agrocybe pediades]